MSYKHNKRTGGTFKVPIESLLARHIYSYREVQVGEFAAAYREAGANKDYERQTRIREKYRSLESGRLAEAMDALNRLVAHLDPDEVELFKARNPEIVKMMNEWAVIEDVKEF
jgi:hypothetical protein